MIRIAVLVLIAVLVASCVAHQPFIPGPVPTLADPPSVTKAEVDRYLKAQRAAKPRRHP